MPQMQLPIFPEGVTHITLELAFLKKDGRVTFFYQEISKGLTKKLKNEMFYDINGSVVILLANKR